MIILKLFTVGPVPCYPKVLEAMGKQMMSHRSEEYIGIHYSTVRQLQVFLETENPIFLFSSTGTGFMEAAIRNCVKNKLIVFINGSFGRRFSDVAKANGKETVDIFTELGHPVQKNMMEEVLEKTPDAEAVAITHNETSVGLINNLPMLTKLAKEHDKLVFVDAVSSMGGTEIKVDEWGIDICFSSSQKCFGVPPGLGIGSVSETAFKSSEEVENKGWYFDLINWKKYHDEGRGTPMTSTIPQVAGLNTALTMIENQGGKHWYFDLYDQRNRKIRKGIEKIGLSTFPVKGYESPTVSCINAPEGITGTEVYISMRRKGYELAQGYGAKKKTTFRIGNMGYIPDVYIEGMLESLSDIV
jgi:aspartate aminotransferase-like enzyme